MYFTPEVMNRTMKTGARRLVRLENADGYGVSDYRAVKEDYRNLLSRSGCRVNSTRISNVAVEVDFFAPGEAEADEARSVLAGRGRILSTTDLMREEPPGSTAQVMEEARKLFNEERFWEVHEKVEGIWRVSSGEEKEVQQSIILYASALVHHQKDEKETTLRMLGRALDKMKGRGSSYYCFDLDRMREEAEGMRRRGSVSIFRL